MEKINPKELKEKLFRPKQNGWEKENLDKNQIMNLLKILANLMSLMKTMMLVLEIKLAFR